MNLLHAFFSGPESILDSQRVRKLLRRRKARPKGVRHVDLSVPVGGDALSVLAFDSESWD